MGELSGWISLGFRHITDPRGADHIVFLLALATTYQWSDWRDLLRVVTAFTLGHSLTLALAVNDLLLLPSELIEFLIPLTIVATVVANVAGRGRGPEASQRWRRAALAAVFGLVHGAGFANYLRQLFVEDVAVPLLGFNVGLELGQLGVLMATLAAFMLLDRALDRVRSMRGWRIPTMRLRTLGVSSVLLVVSVRWTMERAPW